MIDDVASPLFEVVIVGVREILFERAKVAF